MDQGAQQQAAIQAGEGAPAPAPAGAGGAPSPVVGAAGSLPDGGQQQGAGDAEQPAAGTAGAAEDAQSQQARKRQRLAALDHAYEPRDSIDLIIRTADGKRIGVHRLILLRSCGFFRALLEACEEEDEAPVAEAYDELKPHLLDIIYLRSVQIRPETVMRVFQLADKYEAPDIMEACRPVFMSDAFRMRIKAPQAASAGAQQGAAASAAQPAHAEWLDVLALASKHKYEDLFDKSTDFLVDEAKHAPTVAVEAATALMRGKEQLAQLHQSHLLKLTATFAMCTHRVHESMLKKVGEAVSLVKIGQELAHKYEKKVDLKQKAYSKLLARFNRLVNKCEKAGVKWHKDLDPPADGKGKKRKAGGAPGAGVVI